ncbi:MAG: tetratricopeptide repeat protein [Desulfobacterales bacterium]|nr:tetratricopeptide repeat protein [Desulfobacterales bacterium]
MQAKPFSLILIAVAAVLIAGFSPAAAEAQAEASNGPQLLIKVRNIDQLLNDIERLMPAGTGVAPSQQTAMLRGMLQGTEWIDPDRSIVAGMTVKGDISSWIALIPFRTANANFQTAYGAIAGDDYYLMALPPQPGFGVAPDVKASLLAASTDAAASGLVVEAAASELLAMAQPKIAAAIASQAANPAQPGATAVMSPTETQAMLTDMLKMFEQMETVRLGLDLTGDAFTLQFDVDAWPDSFLAGLLIDRGDDVRLADYDVAMPMQFRSRAYNVPGMMQLAASGFGQIYSQMGLDFDEMAEMTKSFTGEMAGGMTADADGMGYEMVYVLQPGVDGQAFILDTYLPWFERYNRQMAAFVAQQANQPQAPPLYERTADTIVEGIKVVGVKTNYNAMLPPGDQTMSTALAGVEQIFETRLAAVGDLVLIGHNDVVMADLITRARGFQTAPAQGPMARFDFDLAAFMQGLQDMLPPGELPTTLPSDLGRLTMQAEMQDGKLATRTRFNVADLAQMGQAFSALAARQAAVAGGGAEAGAPVREASTAPAAKRPTDTPAYWYRRGGLQSAYGAYNAAAKSYRKAIGLAPRYADAHFQLGVVYGEMRQFEAAVMAMTQAIDLNDDQSAFYYGRGRVYLLAGQEEMAMRDFMEAGFRGNPDARAYLNAAGVSLE